MTCSEHREALTAAPTADGVHIQAIRVQGWSTKFATEQVGRLRYVTTVDGGQKHFPSVAWFAHPWFRLYDRRRTDWQTNTDTHTHTHTHTHIHISFLKHIFRLWEWCRIKKPLKKSKSNFGAWSTIRGTNEMKWKEKYEMSVSNSGMKFVAEENGRNSEKNLPRLRFVHHETHMKWPRGQDALNIL